MAEMLHAPLHTGNESNKRKLLLGRKWATENADGTLDTRRWDAFVQRMVNEGILQPVHFDFAQGVGTCWSRPSHWRRRPTAMCSAATSPRSRPTSSWTRSARSVAGLRAGAGRRANRERCSDARTG